MNLEQFKAKCCEDGDCWVWIKTAKSLHNRKHPQMRVNGKTVLARRVGYALARGQIPQGMSIAPTCGNPMCLNPWHQQAMSESQKCSEAAKRGAYSTPARGRAIAVARRGQMKLTEELAREIRESNESHRALAARFGVNKSMVGRIKRGQAWRDYTANPFAGLLAANDSQRRRA